MKKLFCIMFSVLFLLNFTTAFAEAKPEIYSDTVYATQGETVTVPIKIRNNTGIMGFRLTFTYPDKFESPEVLRGALLSEGLLNDSITEATKGTFDVVWSNTQNVTNDGTLLLLSFAIAKDAENGNCQIDISYNQADTFNESMHDVVFDCKSVEVVIGEETVGSTESEITQTVSQKPIEETDSLFLKRTFEKALEIIGAESFDALSDVDFEKFKQLVSNELSAYGALGDELEEKNKEDVEEIYNEAVKDAFVDSVVNTADGDVIDNAIKENLDAVGAENIKSIPPEKQQEFVEGVINTLTENGAEIENLPDSFTSEKFIEVVEAVSSRNEEETGIAIEDLVPEEKPKGYALYIAVGIAVLAIIAAVAVFIIKRKNIKKTNEEDK